MTTNTTRTRARARTVRAALAAAPLAAALLTAGCGPARTAAAPEPKAVTAVKAVRGRIVVSTEYPARIRPREEIVVSPKIAGRVASVSADVSQRVRKGDVLFTLESRDYEAQARQARASLESAKANLTRTSDSSLSSQVIQARAQVKQAQVQYGDAKDLYDRTKKLFDEGTASRQQMDTAKARMDGASIQLDAAQQSLDLIQEKAGPQSTGVASTQVDQAQAAVDLAESQLSNAVITSPIDGVVAARGVDPGELVSSAVPAFVVIDVSTVTAETSVEPGIVARVKPGQRLAVRVDAASTEPLSGTVQSVSPAADQRTQGYTVKIRMANPGDAVRSGMFARVSFPVESRENALTVPNPAVITEGGAQYVLTVADGVVRKATVATGISDAAVTEIVSGLSDGDLVITEGQSFLAEGQKVRVAR
jgi:HlyD family secretion protein